MKIILISALLLMLQTTIYSFEISGKEVELQAQQEIVSWEDVKFSNFTAQIASNSVHHISKSRAMFIYLDKAFFKKKNILLILNYLSASYPEPKELLITMFSNKEMLGRAIKLHFSTSDILFSKTPTGRKAEKEWAARNEPLLTGYFRAFLSRSDAKESITYNPNPKKKQFVYLKNIIMKE